MRVNCGEETVGERHVGRGGESGIVSLGIQVNLLAVVYLLQSLVDSLEDGRRRFGVVSDGGTVDV